MLFFFYVKQHPVALYPGQTVPRGQVTLALRSPASCVIEKNAN